MVPRKLSQEAAVDWYLKACKHFGVSSAKSTHLRRMRVEDANFPAFTTLIGPFGGKLSSLQKSAKTTPTLRGGKYGYSRQKLVELYARIWVFKFRSSGRVEAPGWRDIQAVSKESNSSIPCPNVFLQQVSLREVSAEARDLLLRLHEQGVKCLPSELVDALERFVIPKKREKRKNTQSETSISNDLRNLRNAQNPHAFFAKHWFCNSQIDRFNELPPPDLSSAEFIDLQDVRTRENFLIKSFIYLIAAIKAGKIASDTNKELALRRWMANYNFSSAQTPLPQVLMRGFLEKIGESVRSLSEPENDEDDPEVIALYAELEERFGAES